MNKLIDLIDKLYVWSHKYCEQIIHFLLSTLVIIVSVYCFNFDPSILTSIVVQVEFSLCLIEFIMENKFNFHNCIGGLIGAVVANSLIFIF